MPITNLWDVTFPPDTQLANQLGLDLRNFRLDTQQRMAAISGTLGTRWNPGADTQPLNWTGLLYFTTDTQQIFQWSGSAWVDVSSSILPSRTIFKDTTIHTHTGDVVNDIIYTIPVAGNLMGINKTIRVTVLLVPTVQGGGGNTVITLSFGSLIFATPVITASSFIERIDFYISNRGATNSQIATTQAFCTAGTFIQFASATGAVDTTVNQNIAIQAQNFVNSDSQRFDQCMAEII